MRRRIANTSMLIVAFAVQRCVFPFIPFLSAAPNLMIIMVFTFSFIYGKREGMMYGLISGLLMDLFYSLPLGYFTLFFVWLGYINGALSKYFYEDFIFLPLIMCTVNEFAYNIYIYIFRFFPRAKFDILFYIRQMVLPEMIITLLFTLLMYRLLLQYNRSLEEIDLNRGAKFAE